MTPTLRRLPAAALAALAVAGCAGPDTAEPDEEATAQTADEAAPSLQVALDELEPLRAALAEAREGLAQAGEASSAADARAAADGAVAALADDAPPVLPAETDERGAGTDALMLRAHRAAREAGEAGQSAAGAVGDLLAGDLGAWQRDAAGVHEAIGDVGAPTAAVGDLEEAVLELPGEGARTLAWARLAADAPDAERANRFAENAAVHLDLVLEQLDAGIAELEEARAAREGGETGA